MTECNKGKGHYSNAYIRYINSGESTAVYITRHLAKHVHTRGKWIDVTRIDAIPRYKGLWDIESFEVELFPRLTKPVYPKHADLKEMNYITWQTAQDDIHKQRRRGIAGDVYQIKPRLVNANAGKFKTYKAAWNCRFEKWVPNAWFSRDCVWRERTVPLKPDWQYDIVQVRKL